MAAQPLTEKQVYLALKDIFSIGPTPPSTAKKIRKNIEKYRYDAKVAPLVQRYGVEGITAVAFALSGNQIFASTEKAKTRFPDVFGGFSNELSPVNAPVFQTGTNSAAAVQPAVTESSTAASSAAAMQPVGGVYSPEELMGIGDRLKARNEREKIETASHTQSFDPVAIPFWDQHRILVRVQYTLEKACFDFAQERLVWLLHREGWDCAEAVELNQWARTLLIYREELKLDDMKEDVKPLPSLMESIIQLRHNAVHRVRLSSSGLLQHLTDAVLLAQLLKDDECGKYLSNVRQRTHDAIEELVHNKQLLDGRLADIKKEFAAKRAELERQEAALIEAAVNDHKVPTISVSGGLDRLSGESCGAAGGAHAPWLRVDDAALPDNESSGSEGVNEGTTRQSPEDEATEVTDDGSDTVSPPPVHAVPTPPFNNGLPEPVIHPGQQQADKGENDDLSAAGEVPIEKSELDNHKSDQEHSLDPPPLDQNDTTTDTEEAMEEHEKSLEKAYVSDWEGSKFQDNDEEVFYEPSTSLASTCIERTEPDTEKAYHEVTIKDLRVLPCEGRCRARKKKLAADESGGRRLPMIWHAKRPPPIIYENTTDAVTPPGYETIVNAVMQAINNQNLSELEISEREDRRGYSPKRYYH